jgi:hypothetical protein
VFFAPQHAGDAATKLSRTALVAPLLVDSQDLPALATQFGYGLTARLQNDATRSALLDVLHGRNQQRPSVLFTAGHGVGFPLDDPRQPADQGALLMQDWTGIGSIEPNHYVRAADINADAQVHGLVAFFFACYGAGTPQKDAFPMALDTPPADIAAKPFVAALPKRLLSHSNGGALGVFGHVDRAWGFSIKPAGVDAGPNLAPFWNTLARVLSGKCLGNALKDMSERSASLSAELLDDTGPAASPVGDIELVSRWIERNDAQSYILLGDPGAHLRSGDLK